MKILLYLLLIGGGGYGAYRLVIYLSDESAHHSGVPSDDEVNQAAKQATQGAPPTP